MQLRGSSFHIYNSDLKIEISATKYVYPDLSVVCGAAQFSDDKHTLLTKPTLVAEVLSVSSANYDRLPKVNFYRSLTSVQGYLLLEQDRAFAQLYTRQGVGWLLREFEECGTTVPLASVGIDLALAEVYRNVKFSP